MMIVKTFESNYANFIGVNHCIGVGNGTDALEIAIESLNLPKDGEIIVPANSFISSAEAVTRSGCKVVFCDARPDDYTIDISDLKIFAKLSFNNFFFLKILFQLLSNF